MNEQWKVVPSYPHLQASNLGRIRNTKTNRILGGSTNNCGYKQISVASKKLANGKFTSVLVMKHRLVAEAWIPNLDNKSEIDHINHNRKDNRIENLRWCTRQENMDNTTVNNIIKARSKAVINDDTLEVFPSAAEAARKLGIYHRNAVTQTCKKGGSCYSSVLDDYTSFSYFHKKFDYDNYFETGKSKYNEQ